MVFQISNLRPPYTPVFATKLTFPENVTAHNVELLRQLVENGPHQHPVRRVQVDIGAG